ncbi:hypothetical protein [Halobacteriovorax sp. HLS]|uniref:hypothetical protein n=1 Tax=Halobacteriovorax sp. HLS TaxID=2234000 RepID=UPI000FDA65EA|nr:hypothetical protein [Halobacteriovorax sp. HLS]
MKYVIILISLLSINSLFAAEATRENILFSYKKSLDGYYPDYEIEQRYNGLTKLSAKVDSSTLDTNFISVLTLDSLKPNQDEMEVMSSLVYACLNESYKEDIYKKCTSMTLTEELDGYYGEFAGRNDQLDTMIEDFFEVQTALLELTPAIKSEKINNSKRGSKSIIDDGSSESSNSSNSFQQ